MAYFATMGSLLKQGFSTVANAFIPGGQAAIKTVGYAASGFFPAEQREKVRHIVSQQPYETFLGYRPTVPQAQTLRSPFINWWSSKIVQPVRKYFAGQSIQDIGRQTAKTLAETTQAGIRQIGGSLVDYFVSKWGLVTRPGEQNDYSYYNATQSKAPATKTVPDNFFAYPSQPVGSFFLGNPQSAPIPSQAITDRSDYAGSAGMMIMPGAATAGISSYLPILLIGGAIALIYFLRR